MQTLLPMVERSRHNPYEISIAIALTALSLYGILLTPASSSLDAGLSVGQRFAYSSLGLVGSVTTLAGLGFRNTHTGLLIERAGQFMMAFGAGAFVVVLCMVTSFDESGLVTATGSAIGIAAAWRFRQITRDLRTWQERIQSAQTILEAALTEVESNMPDVESGGGDA